jgi:glycosyltransferase involved in cell wall biosynthesis
MLGNLSVDKGLDSFARIARVVAAKTDAVDFVLAGPIGDDSRALADALAADLGPRLRVMGFVDGSRKDAVLREASVLLFPSTYVNEAAPLVMYEAMAYGVWILSTDVGACAEIAARAGGVAFDVVSYCDAAADEIIALARAHAHAPVDRRQAIREAFLMERGEAQRDLDAIVEEFIAR